MPKELQMQNPKEFPKKKIASIKRTYVTMCDLIFYFDVKNVIKMVCTWRVSEKHSLSDRRNILFAL